MARADLGVHLVGSLCGAETASDAFRKSTAAFPNRLRRLPDGEPGHRGGFTGFQREVLARHIPEAIRDWTLQTPGPAIPAAQLAATLAKLPSPLATGYDAAAIESYAAFAQLRAAGAIPARTRFQVCLPTAAGVMVFAATGYQAALEPVYERALVAALRGVLAAVPPEDLAVQVDVASEIATLEGVYYPHCAPYYPGPVLAHVVERVRVLVDAVPPEVEVGLHLCYGDLGHEHFVQPRDTGLLVEVAGAVMKAVGRELQWVHLPVPKDRDDEAYFEPLKGLEWGQTELYLGLVHPGDEEGTERRLRTAERVLGHRRFGVGSECGMGRTPAEEFESIAKISTEVSSPVV
ncbi:putative carboxy- -muconate cyclase protein [Neofusicoccum parvum]|nr:putative carboxy- -muconate cyclase protein [Neofusicoccum parvum]